MVSGGEESDVSGLVCRAAKLTGEETLEAEVTDKLGREYHARRGVCQHTATACAW